VGEVGYTSTPPWPPQAPGLSTNLWELEQWGKLGCRREGKGGQQRALRSGESVAYRPSLVHAI